MVQDVLHVDSDSIVTNQQLSYTNKSHFSNFPVCLNTHVAYSNSSPVAKYYDNACSYSMVPNRIFLSDVKPLIQHFPIGGLGGSTVLATHYGYIKGFPHALAKAYWGPQFDVFLISLGYLQMCGSYISKGHSLQVLILMVL